MTSVALTALEHKTGVLARAFPWGTEPAGARYLETRTSAGGFEMTDIHAERVALFANLESAETQPDFWGSQASRHARPGAAPPSASRFASLFAQLEV